jgi:hypothetical protein
MTDRRPTLMKTTPGITAPNLTLEPLGTEGELSEGPDHINPHRSVQEREIVEQYKRKRREREDDQLWKSGMDIDPESVEWVAAVGSPVEGPDPFAFDDIDSDSFDLPTLDFEGPQF